jgi:peptidoglycan DL-endopeptidase CwlO
MKRLLTVFLLLVVVHLARGDDDTLHNVYHSLKRFGHHVKDKFTGDDSETTKKSSTTIHHRKSSHKTSTTEAKDHPSPTPAPVESTPSPSPSPIPVPVGTATPESTPTPASTPSDPATSASKNQSNHRSNEEPDKKVESDQKVTDQKVANDANVASLKPEEISGFSSQPEKVQQLIRNALDLTERHLNYQYGSSDPAAGGMDCSGFIYYVLNQAGYKDVPRDSSEQYAWVRKNDDFRAVLSRSQDSFELKELKAGDLMFWSGTYKANRDIPITHVMIYLGKEKATGKQVMVGATDGRTYDGIRRSGVSVFDFKMPSGQPNKNDPELTAKFEGYGSVPGLRTAGQNANVSLIDRSNSETSSTDDQPVPKKKAISKKKRHAVKDE